MPATAIRPDIPAGELRRLARLEDDGRVASRLLAIAAVLDGHSRGADSKGGGARFRLSFAWGEHR